MTDLPWTTLMIDIQTNEELIELDSISMRYEMSIDDIPLLAHNIYQWRIKNKDVAEYVMQELKKIKIAFRELTVKDVMFLNKYLFDRDEL